MQMEKEARYIQDQTAQGDMTYIVKQLKVGFSFIKNYTYIIVDKASQQAAIVDPSWELRTVVKTLDELGARLTTILLTHSHFDHVNMVQPLLKRFNPQVYMSAQEIEYYNYRCANLNGMEHLDTIEVGRTHISCLLTPGHTAGGACFLLSDSIFTGDTVFIEGCGICNAGGGCPEKMFDSIQMLKEHVHPEVRVYPAHSFGRPPGPALRDVMKENIYFLIDKKNVFVDFRMRKSFKKIFDFC